MNHSYLCIDLKSYYASVECVDRGLDPFTANLVVADQARGMGALCLAVSPALKALGVRNRCRLFEIPRGIPYLIAPPRMQHYMDVSTEIYKIYLKFLAPEDIFPYSIDECFVYFQDLEGVDLKAWGEQLHRKIRRWVGMPVSVGIGPNKTLAKVASHFAKKYPGYHHCCLIDSEEKREKALGLYPVEEVWGVGRRYAAKLAAYGVRTALDFARLHGDFVRAHFNNIVIYRTWAELNGKDCVPNEEYAKKKSICTSRSFDGMVADLDTLSTHVANYAARCAEKLRAQHSVASVVGVFLHTNPFREDLGQYWNFEETRILTPTHSTATLVQTAKGVLRRIFRPGYQYKKAGVIVMGVSPESPVQQDLFDVTADQYGKARALDEALDRINRTYGSKTIVLGAQQYTRQGGEGKAGVFADAIKHEYKSPNPTTRWCDIIKLKAGDKE